MSGTTLTAGLDLGSTAMKILLTDLDGEEVLTEQVATPWRAGPGGTTELDAGTLMASVTRLLGTAALRLADLPGARLGAVAVSGMGETGVLIDARGEVAAPSFAWFDPRGAEQAAAFPAEIRAEFAGRTGLPLGAQVTVAKLAYLRDEGLRLRGLRWLNLPEFVARSLGGETLLERSLTSRTGLLDQDTGAPWPAMLEALGVGPDFLPDQVDAGAPFGRAVRGVPAAFAGALLTVAGHDHLVAAEADGALPRDHYHVSMGTAEVLLRIIDAPLGYDARARLAGHLINEVRHVVPGKHVLVAGVKTGLLLRRALQLAGITDREGRDVLDAAAVALPYEGLLAEGGIEVSGARNDDGVLKLTLRTDGVSPAEVFDAVLRHSNDEIRTLVAAMDAELPPATSSTLTGGWADMASVRRARSLVLPRMTTSQRQQETAFGASRVAARLLRELPARPPTHPPHRSEPQVTSLNTLERRGMTAISTPAGHMLIVAADQRNSMKAVMKDAPDGTSAITTAELSAAKADLITFLASQAPAILLDPEVALPAVVDEAVLPRQTALVVGMDASGFESVDGLRHTRFVDGITPRAVRDLGGDVAKMLWYTRPDRQGPESRVAEEIRQLVKACESEGLLLIVELLTYQLEDESDEAYASAFSGLVVEGARLAVACGAKVLKLQYPGSAEACAAVTEAAAGAPWAVLSAGVDHTTFVEQVAVAMANGASGAMAGRSLWKDSLSISHDVRRDLLTNRALPRLRELNAVVDGTR